MFGINKLPQNNMSHSSTLVQSPFGIATPAQSPFVIGNSSFGIDKSLRSSTQPSPQNVIQPVSNDIVRMGELLDKVVINLATVHQKVEETSVLLNQKIDTMLEPKIYVACPLHNHVLLETTSISLGDTYHKGFMCDVCKKTCNNSMVKFYQCSQCPSSIGVTGGKFDVCAECVKKQLAT